MVKVKRKRKTILTSMCSINGDSSLTCIVIMCDEHADLREDKHYMADHPGLMPVTTEQVQIFHHHICIQMCIEFSKQ